MSTLKKTCWGRGDSGDTVGSPLAVLVPRLNSHTTSGRWEYFLRLSAGTRWLVPGHTVVRADRQPRPSGKSLGHLCPVERNVLESTLSRESRGCVDAFRAVSRATLMKRPREFPQERSRNKAV